MTVPDPAPEDHARTAEERDAARRRLVLVVVAGVLVVNLGTVALNIGGGERSMLGWIGLVLALVSLLAVLIGAVVLTRARRHRR